MRPAAPGLHLLGPPPEGPPSSVGLACCSCTQDLRSTNISVRENLLAEVRYLELHFHSAFPTGDADQQSCPSPSLSLFSCHMMHAKSAALPFSACFTNKGVFSCFAARSPLARGNAAIKCTSVPGCQQGCLLGLTFALVCAPKEERLLRLSLLSPARCRSL